MKKTLFLLFILSFSLPMFAQNTTLTLLNGIEYQLENKKWEVEPNKTINVPYHFEYQLQDKKQVSKLRVRINSMDYKLKDSIYSDLEIKKRTALGELEDFKSKLSKLKNENLIITYLSQDDYKGFKLLTVIIKMQNDKTNHVVMSIGIKVLNDYLVVGVSIENFVNSTSEESIALLKKHLKRIK